MITTTDTPIIIGLCGKAATGKTTTAQTLCPPSSMAYDKDRFAMTWHHTSFAAPLYEMASIRKTIVGYEEEDRQLYELHDIISKLMGGRPINGAPAYNELVDLVHHIQAMPIEMEGKPRSFLQRVGTICRGVKEDCFINSVLWRIEEKYRIHQRQEEYSSPYHATLVSDLRMVNEAEAIHKQKGGVIIKFTASDEVRHERMLIRDGIQMNEEQAQHESEAQVDMIPEDMIDLTIDTNKMDLKDQAFAVRDFIVARYGVSINLIETYDIHEAELLQRLYIDWIDQAMQKSKENDDLQKTKETVTRA